MSKISAVLKQLLFLKCKLFRFYIINMFALDDYLQRSLWLFKQTGKWPQSITILNVEKLGQQFSLFVSSYYCLI